MDKVELARGRNWQKARLVSNVVNTSYLTDEEKGLLKRINNLKQIMLRNWDTNSEVLGLSVVRYDVYIDGKLWKERVPYYMAKFYATPKSSSITYKRCKP